VTKEELEQGIAGRLSSIEVSSARLEESIKNLAKETVEIKTELKGISTRQSEHVGSFRTLAWVVGISVPLVVLALGTLVTWIVSTDRSVSSLKNKGYAEANHVPDFARKNLVSFSGILDDVSKKHVSLVIEKEKKSFILRDDSQCWINGRLADDWRDMVGWKGEKTTVFVSGKNSSEISLIEVGRKPGLGPIVVEEPRKAPD
jgi:hypothetical protein